MYLNLTSYSCFLLMIIIQDNEAGCPISGVSEEEQMDLSQRDTFGLGGREAAVLRRSCALKIANLRLKIANPSLLSFPFLFLALHSPNPAACKRKEIVVPI